MKDDDGDNKGDTLTLTIINESFNQPFSPFFVIVHNSTARLYVRGEPASDQLALLAENGNPGPLVEMKPTGSKGVFNVSAFTDGAPYFGGDKLQIEVQVSKEYSLVAIATMAINTNDCFTAINGMKLKEGMVVDCPGLDTGRI